MEWAEKHDADYIFGLGGNAAPDALVAETAVNLRFHRRLRKLGVDLPITAEDAKPT
jgi:hypothetical protein